MDNEEVFKVMSQNNNVLLNDFDRGSKTYILIWIIYNQITQNIK